MFIRLTMPAASYIPERPIAVCVDHIISVAPRYVVHPDDKLKVAADKRTIVEGTWIETTAHVGPEEPAMFHVVEDFDIVMASIPEGEVR